VSRLVVVSQFFMWLCGRRVLVGWWSIEHHTCAHLRMHVHTPKSAHTLARICTSVRPRSCVKAHARAHSGKRTYTCSHMHQRATEVVCVMRQGTHAPTVNPTCTHKRASERRAQPHSHVYASTLAAALCFAAKFPHMKQQESSTVRARTSCHPRVRWSLTPELIRTFRNRLDKRVGATVQMSKLVIMRVEARTQTRWVIDCVSRTHYVRDGVRSMRDWIAMVIQMWRMHGHNPNAMVVALQARSSGPRI